MLSFGKKGESKDEKKAKENAKDNQSDEGSMFSMSLLSRPQSKTPKDKESIREKCYATFGMNGKIKIKFKGPLTQEIKGVASYAIGYLVSGGTPRRTMRSCYMVYKNLMVPIETESSKSYHKEKGECEATFVVSCAGWVPITCEEGKECEDTMNIKLNDWKGSVEFSDCAILRVCFQGCAKHLIENKERVEASSLMRIEPSMESIEFLTKAMKTYNSISKLQM